MKAKNRSRSIAALLFGAAAASFFFIHPHRSADPAASADAESGSVASRPAARTASPSHPMTGASGQAALPPRALDLPGHVQMNTQTEAAPAWTVRYGDEFWRVPAVNVQAKASSATIPLAAAINLGDVIERVSHAAEIDPETDRPRVNARTYSATFDGEGVRFSPHRVPAAVETKSLRVTQPPEPDPNTEAAFRTVSISRDGQTLYAVDAAPAEWSILGNTAQALLTPALGLVEHYEARQEGVEVTWVVPRALPGHGPLVVEAELSGLAYAGPSANGHRFADASGTPRMRVGQVNVVDASGHSVALPLRVEGRRLQVEVPAAILAQATYPLAIDPMLGAEFAIDGRNALTSTVYDDTPAVAFNGTHFLAVWTDYRNTASAGTDIYGTRLSMAGAVLDPAGIPVSVAPKEQNHPAIAAKGSDFLVAWEDYRNDLATGADIYAAKVNAAGIVAQNNGVPIHEGPADQILPALSANNTGFLLAYENHLYGPGNSDIWISRIRLAGDLIQKDNIDLSNYGADQTVPAVAACGEKFQVVWTEAWDLAATGLDIAGQIVPGFGVAIDGGPHWVCHRAGTQRNSAVAANGSEYLVVWQDYRNAGAGADVYGARVSKDGLLVASADGNPDGDFPICVWPSDQINPALASFGSDFLVVWQDYRNASRDVCGMRVSSAGVVMDGSVMNINNGPNNAYAPALAFAPGGKALVVSQTYRDGATRAVGNRVIPNASAGVFQFSAANYAVSEGAAHAVITVKRLNGSAGAAQVRYATQNGTASSGSDYTGVSGMLTFNPGQTVATFSVPIINDARDETNETVLLTLDSPTGGATLGAQSYAKLTINDNDSGGVIQFATASRNVAENATTVLLNVVRTGGVAGNVTVTYATVELTGAMHATASQDYVGVLNTLTFDAGQTAKQIQITLKPDALHEGLEKFKVVLSTPTGGATLGLKKETLVNILDDDP